MHNLPILIADIFRSWGRQLTALSYVPIGSICARYDMSTGQIDLEDLCIVTPPEVQTGDFVELLKSVIKNYDVQTTNLPMHDHTNVTSHEGPKSEMELTDEIHEFPFQDFIGQTGKCHLRIYKGNGKAVVVASQYCHIDHEVWSKLSFNSIADKLIVSYGLPLESTSWVSHDAVIAELKEYTNEVFYRLKLEWLPSSGCFNIPSIEGEMTRNDLEELIGQRFSKLPPEDT